MNIVSTAATTTPQPLEWPAIEAKLLTVPPEKRRWFLTELVRGLNAVYVPPLD